MSEPGQNFPGIGTDPADDGSLGGAFRSIYRKLLQYTDGMLPCKVIAATDDRNYVTVQILMLVVGTGGDTKDRSQIAKVPMMNMGAGDYVLSFPVKPGDLGWIVASDRDISLYLQSNKAAKPNTGRFHSFEDGLFIPDNARKWTLAGADADRVVLQSLDGTKKITIGSDQISIVHPTKVEITSPAVHMTGDLTIDGKLTAALDVSLGGGSQFLKRADGSNTTKVKGT